MGHHIKASTLDSAQLSGLYRYKAHSFIPSYPPYQCIDHWFGTSPWPLSINRPVLHDPISRLDTSFFVSPKPIRRPSIWRISLTSVTLSINQPVHCLPFTGGIHPFSSSLLSWLFSLTLLDYTHTILQYISPNPVEHTSHRLSNTISFILKSA